MRRRRSPTIITLLVILAAVLAAAAYFRIVEFTLSARAFITDEISAATGRKAFASSVGFDMLKGLTLENFVLHDGRRYILRAREVSCGFILPAVLSKRIVIPSITVSEPAAYVERSPDGAINLAGLIPKEYRTMRGVSVSVHKIVVRSGKARFVDMKVPGTFEASAEDIDAEIRLYLPIRATFKGSFDLPPSRVEVSGEYVVPEEALHSNVVVKNVSLKAFGRYYESAPFRFPSGSVDARAYVGAGPGTLDVKVAATAKGLIVESGTARARVDCAITASAKTDGPSGALKYNGKADVRSMEIDNVEGIGRIADVRGVFDFNEERIFSDSVRAEAVDLPWQARVNIVNYRAPIMDIYARSDVHLGALQKMLKGRFSLVMPGEFSGTGRLSVSIQSEPARPLRMNGSLSFEDATMGLGSGNFPVEKMSGSLLFAGEELRFQGLKLLYRGVGYSASGRLAGFAEPHIDISVASRDLSYKAELAVKGSIIKVLKLDGKHLGSTFSADGSISLEDPAAMDAELSGRCDFDLADLRRMADESGGVRKMRPSGILHAAFELSGDLKDLKTCYAKAMLKSKLLSIYGAAFSGISFGYEQEQGVGSIKSLRSGFYGGTLAASGTVDWVSRAVPWALQFDAIGVKLDKLKADSGFSDRDVSGTLKIFADLNGTLKDASRLAGIGHIGIANGKLWQLDLFKGAGKAIFSSDFSDIEFTEGACDFRIGGGDIRIENLVMKSEELKLTGRGEIAADRSVSGTLRPEISEDAVATGTTGKFAMAVGKGTVIEVSGTLKEPRFKTKTNVVDVVSAFMEN